MKSLFVVMRGGSHPGAIVIPSPWCVFSCRKDANKWIKSRKFPCEYYVRKAEDMTEEGQ